MMLLLLLAAISVEKGPLPEGLPTEGKVVAQARFKDTAGSHVVVVTETDEVRKGDGRNKKLFGYPFDLGAASDVFWRRYVAAHRRASRATASGRTGRGQVERGEPDGAQRARQMVGAGSRFDGATHPDDRLRVLVLIRQRASDFTICHEPPAFFSWKVHVRFCSRGFPPPTFGRHIALPTHVARPAAPLTCTSQ